jgi:hypothetical protein
LFDGFAEKVISRVIDGREIETERIIEKVSFRSVVYVPAFWLLPCLSLSPILPFVNRYDSCLNELK